MTSPQDEARPDVVDGLEMLERLRERGLIDEEEFATKKAALLAASTVAPPGAPALEPSSGAPVRAPDGSLAWGPAPAKPGDPYPVRFDVAYPDRLSRGKTFFRAILIYPVVLFGYLIQYFALFALLIGFTTVFWRKKYPDWLFRGLSGAYGFSARSFSYALLVTDKYPSFSRDQSPVTLEFDDPPSGLLSRWRVLFWKYTLLIPHFFVLSLLALALFAVTVIAWFAILFTGRYPRGLFQFTVGVQRWWWRVIAYFTSFNDRFPPYTLSPEAGPAGNGATVASGLIGAAAAAGIVTLFAVVAAISDNYYTAEINYARLEAGTQQPSHTFKESFGDDSVLLRLTRVVDPGNDLIAILNPAPGERVVVFQWTVVNGTESNALVTGEAARLKYQYRDEDGDLQARSATSPVIAVNNVVAPAKVRAGGTATVRAVFVIPEDAIPSELRFQGGFSRGGVKYVFD